MNKEKLDHAIEESSALRDMRQCIELVMSIDTWDKEKIERIVFELRRAANRIYMVAFYQGADYAANANNGGTKEGSGGVPPSHFVMEPSNKEATP